MEAALSGARSGTLRVVVHATVLAEVPVALLVPEVDLVRGASQEVRQRAHEQVQIVQIAIHIVTTKFLRAPSLQFFAWLGGENRRRESGRLLETKRNENQEMAAELGGTDETIDFSKTSSCLSRPSTAKEAQWVRRFGRFDFT